MSIKAFLGGLLWRVVPVEHGDGRVTIRVVPRLRFLPVIGPITIDLAASAEANCRAVENGVKNDVERWWP
jgi:hypothetical protein